MKTRKKIAVIFLSLLMCVITASCGISDYIFEPQDEDSSESKVTEVEDSSESKVTEVEVTQKKKTYARSTEKDFEIVGGVLMSYTGNESHIVIPNNVIKINERAFWSINTLESVVIPGSVKEIGSSAFWSCAGLEFVHIAEGVRTIDKSVFWSCPSLADVNLPKSVTEIEDSAFANCDALKIHAPKDSVSESYAIKNKITYDNSIVVYSPDEESKKTKIPASKYQYGTFTSFEIEDGITEIGADAFSYCKTLEMMKIPSSVRKIGGNAFEYCYSLSFVDIDDGCVEIGSGAFEYCRSLKDANIPESVEKIEDSAFDYCGEDFTIHTPKGSYAESFAIKKGFAYDNTDVEK